MITPLDVRVLRAESDFLVALAGAFRASPKPQMVLLVIQLLLAQPAAPKVRSPV